MSRQKRAEEWNALFPELTDSDKMILRSLALTKRQRQTQKPVTKQWVMVIGEPLLIGDQRNPNHSQPHIGRRASDQTRLKVNGKAWGGSLMLSIGLFPWQGWGAHHLPDLLNNAYQTHAAIGWLAIGGVLACMLVGLPLLLSELHHNLNRLVQFNPTPEGDF